MSSGKSTNQVVGDVALVVEDLSCTLDGENGPGALLKGVSLELRRGEALGIVGESGSGKTMLARAILGIVPRHATITGRVLVGGVNILELPPAQRRRKVGAEIGMVFQNPMTSLNPVVPIGRQLTEGLRFHLPLSRAQRRVRAIELLGEVGIA